MTDKSNIQKLTERINRCENPRAMLAALYVIMSAFRGRPDTITPEAIWSILEGQEKGGAA